MKMFLVISLSILASITNAWEFKEGTYESTISKSSSQSAYLMLKQVSGRKGSFIAALILADKKEQTKNAYLYLMDEQRGGSYSLTPLSIVDKGEVGIDDDNPSLVIIKDGKENNFKVTSSQSGNVLGYNGSISFEEGMSLRYSWQLSKNGDYSRTGQEDEKAMISIAVSSHDIENDAVFEIPSDIVGIFKIRQKMPYVYSINSNKLLATGYEREEIPSRLAIYVQENRKKGFSKKWVKKQDLILLISPKGKEYFRSLVRKQ